MTWIELLGNGAELGPSSLVGVFVAGLMVGLGPGSLGLVSVMTTGYVLGAEPKQGWVRLVAFLAGSVVAGMMLGAIFAAAGWLVGEVIGPAWNGLIGLILIVMGLRLLPAFALQRVYSAYGAPSGRDSRGGFFLWNALCLRALTLLIPGCAVRVDSRG